MEKFQYEELVIGPAAQQLRDSGRWTLNLSIAKHRGSGVTDKMFSAEKISFQPKKRERISRRSASI